MKYKQGFVSNSSSSNFIVVVDSTVKDVIDHGNFLLPHKLAQIIINEENSSWKSNEPKMILDHHDRVYITYFCSDSDPLDLFGDPFEDKLPDGYKDVFSLDDGNHGRPYNQSDFVMVIPGEKYEKYENWGATWIHKKYIVKLLEEMKNED